MVASIGGFWRYRGLRIGVDHRDIHIQLRHVFYGKLICAHRGTWDLGHLQLRNLKRNGCTPV